MPTYDYRCNACGHTFELFQSMTEAVKRKCPTCGKPKLERLIGMGAGILFKGGGFYQTDYRSDAYKKDQAAESKDSKPSQSESKTPAAPAESKAASTKPKPPATKKKASPKKDS